MQERHSTEIWNANTEYQLLKEIIYNCMKISIFIIYILSIQGNFIGILMEYDKNLKRY